MESKQVEAARQKRAHEISTEHRRSTFSCVLSTNTVIIVKLLGLVGIL